MIGLSRTTGQMLTGWPLFVELVEDALSTQLHSREKRRDYGSRLPELLSKITGDDTLMLAQIYATQTFIHPPNQLNALFAVDRIVASRLEAGIALQITGRYLSEHRTFEVKIYAP